MQFNASRERSEKKAAEGFYAISLPKTHEREHATRR